MKFYPHAPLLGSTEVSTLTADSTNSSTLVIAWESPADPNGDILGYFVSIINLKDGSTVRHEDVSTTSIIEIDLGRFVANTLQPR